ncbi:hypothetical protein ACFL5V_09220 [Fibrobacterota bacterium]
MRTRTLIPIFFLCICAFAPRAQESSSPDPVRKYRLLFGAPDESEPFATAGVTLNKAFMDLYHRGIAPKVPPAMAPWTEILWSIHWSFFFTMWPHDGGHWARAQQVGGNFVITGFGYPFPTAEMRLPADLDKKLETLTSIGGHEINFLMREQIHMDYYTYQHIFADELIHAFVQDVFYPFYAFVIAYANPDDPSVWTDTRGDPVESTLSVFESYTGRPPVRGDGTVDPGLIDQYRESTILSVVWPLFNPLFYRSLKAFGADMSRDHGLMTAPWMYGSGKLAYSWGTHFHPSPLGYELYLTNYFRLLGRLYVLGLKAGRPYKNNGIGLRIPRLAQQGKVYLGAAADFWDQDIYGRGGSVALDVHYQPARGIGVTVKGGWKSEGYLVGRRVDSSPLVLAGCSYFF